MSKSKRKDEKKRNKKTQPEKELSEKELGKVAGGLIVETSFPAVSPLITETGLPKSRAGIPKDK